MSLLRRCSRTTQVTSLPIRIFWPEARVKGPGAAFVSLLLAPTVTLRAPSHGSSSQPHSATSRSVPADHQRVAAQSDRLHVPACDAQPQLGKLQRRVSDGRGSTSHPAESEPNPQSSSATACESRRHRVTAQRLCRSAPWRGLQAQRIAVSVYLRGTADRIRLSQAYACSARHCARQPHAALPSGYPWTHQPNTFLTTRVAGWQHKEHRSVRQRAVAEPYTSGSCIAR